MLRNVAARGAAWCLLMGSIAARRADAQGWNDARTRALVAQATTRRAEQLADTALRDYQASAHGYVTFLAQVGQGFPEPPKIVKADELALQVYWRSPSLSKQIIQGRRDTLLLPTDIQYHRDHLAIVQNNFPSIIRLGEGDEVRDVPHPLSAVGLDDYDFAISDSLSYHLPGRTIRVYEVKVRPKDDKQPRVIGAVYIDTAGAQVVRMAFNFTTASFLDKQLEDVSIVLENGLIQGRFWLPRRQEIEIRRTGTWMDYPVRGIIRGRWEIGDYQVNTNISPAIFAGPEIVQVPPYQQKRYAFPSRDILDSLPPDVRMATDADVQRVQAEARALVRGQALQRAQTSALAARGISQIVRVNRVEGLALGIGGIEHLPGGFDARAYGRFGLADHEWKGQFSLGWQNGAATEVRVFGLRDFRDMGDVPERSGAVNSIAAQEFGSDYTDPYRVAGGGAQLGVRGIAGLDWTLTGGVEQDGTVTVHAVPVSGHFQVTRAVSERDDFARLALRADRPTALSFLGTELRLSAEFRGLRGLPMQCAVLTVLALPGTPAPPPSSGCYQSARVFVSADIERPIGGQRIVGRTYAGAVGFRDGFVAPQELIYLGGPTTGPGYDFHEFVARVGVSQRLELQTPIPFPAISLGRFGRSPAQAKLAPFVNAIYVRPARPDEAGLFPLPSSRVTGVYPSVGVGVLTFFDLLRIDVARGLRGGRWTFNVDVSRDLWSVL